MRFFRIPSFTGIESHRDDADRGSLRVVEGCLPHGPGGVRSAPVWEDVATVTIVSESEYHTISAHDDGKGNSLIYVSRLGQVTDIAVMTTENTALGPFDDHYLVSQSTVHNEKTGAVAPLGDRKFAVGDGTHEAVYFGKGPPVVSGGATVFPDEVLYRQEWSRFPKCKFYARGPNKSLFAAGNPDKPLTIYISEPAGSTNPNLDSPYSTEMTGADNNPGKLSTVDILASEASKITALSTNGSQVIVHTDKGCHLLYAPTADQADTGYRVVQAPSSVFSAAVNSRVVSSDNGSMIFWFGHDGQIYKDESASRGSEDAKKYTDPEQANWKSKGVWESKHPDDLTDSFAFYCPQSGYYWVFIRSRAFLNEAGNLDVRRPTKLIGTPAAPSQPAGLLATIFEPLAPTNLLGVPQAPSAPTDLVSVVQVPQAPTNLTGGPTTVPAPPTDLAAAGMQPPVTGPSSLVLSEAIPLSGPTNLTSSLQPPALGPTSLALVSIATPPTLGPSNLVAGLRPPVVGPSKVSTSFVWDQSTAFDSRESLLVFRSISSNFVATNLENSTLGPATSNIAPATASTGLTSTGDGTVTNPYMNAWYPEGAGNGGARTIVHYTNAANLVRLGLWLQFIYSGTRNSDDIGLSFGNYKWLTTNGTQHSWRMKMQGSATSATYWLVYDTTEGRYVVIKGNWLSASNDNGTYSSIQTMLKLNNFNNSLDANNPFGTYHINSSGSETNPTHEMIHVGSAVYDASSIGQGDYQVRYGFPNASVQGIQVDAETASLVTTF